MNLTESPALAELEHAAHAAGLSFTPLDPGVAFGGEPTVRFSMGLPAATDRSLMLELGRDFDADDPRFAGEMATFFAEVAGRLTNPRPDCYLSLLGLPLSFGKFAWPFHGSTSGADTFIVHGEIRLETGEESILHAKVSASLTQTFRDVVSALQQPFTEGFIYNAVRKTLDQGQLEMVKSGNRQPVPVTTRYYSAKQKRFVFNDTSADQREQFLAGHVFWLSHVLGGDQSVWIADPRDAQYLNTEIADLKAAADTLVVAGLITISGNGARAVATEKLKAERPRFEAEVAEALAFIKPTFNEDMRGGLTNM